MAKDMLYGDESREKLFIGVDKLAKAVATTLGPKGRNVVIAKKFGPPLITKDGVSVAREIELKDPYENIGAQLIKEAATKTNESAGDGTTTATVLAHALCREGVKMVAAGHDPMQIKKGIDNGILQAIEIVDESAKAVTSKEDIFHVATISANNDQDIGSCIADAMERVGKDGVVTVEESPTLETMVTYTEGMQFDRGYLSPYFSTNENFEAVLDEPLILLSNDPINNIHLLAPLMEMVQRQGHRPLLVIAESIDGDALTALVVNHAKGVLRSCAVKAPGYGENRLEQLEDIAVLTKGKVISKDLGVTLMNVTLDMFGTCKMVKSTSRDTVIIGGAGDEDEIKKRIAQIRHQISECTSDYEREKLQSRLAKLSGGVAVINVGAATEVEMKEKKHRVEDALSTARAAIESGIVPGGGIALLRAAEKIAEFNASDLINADPGFVIGRKIVARALEEPLRQIVFNAGESADVVINKAKEVGLKSPANGFNAANSEWGNMFTMGIIDPAKVTMSALRYSGSVASMLLTTECAMIDLPLRNIDEMME